jgi:hypothetical protein
MNISEVRNPGHGESVHDDPVAIYRGESVVASCGSNSNSARPEARIQSPSTVKASMLRVCLAGRRERGASPGSKRCLNVLPRRTTNLMRGRRSKCGDGPDGSKNGGMFRCHASALRRRSKRRRRSCRASSAVVMSTCTNRVGVCGCIWPIKSMSAEITAPSIK